MDVVAELERARVEGEADGAGEHDDELQGDVHPRAQLAAEAAEAAADHGAFWDMHDILLEHQDLLGPSYLVRNAEQLGIDVEWFTNHCRTTPALPASPKTLTAPT